MEENLSAFQLKDRPIMEELLKHVKDALKDSDAGEEKDIIRKFLQEMSEVITFAAIGNTGVGKSSFLNAYFQGALFDGTEAAGTRNIQEYRYGAEEAFLKVSEEVRRIFRHKEPLDGLQVIDMPGLNQMHRKETLECIKRYIGMSSALFVIYEAGSVTDAAVWDILERAKPGKVVFILTKCDQVESEVIRKNEARLCRYMEDAGIHAPVFPVSSKWEREGQGDQSGFLELRKYIAEQVMGENPVLTKQKENFLKLKKMLADLEKSIKKRRQQYEADLSVLEKINSGMDTFMNGSQEQTEDLKESLKREIEREIDAYQQEIVHKLDPMKIKEYFPNGSSDFMDYLNLVNEGYRKRMTDNVNRRTKKSVRQFLVSLEGVFEESIGYLNQRSVILSAEDRFYGTLAESKKHLVNRAENDFELTKDYYHSLADASTELFMELWKARNERDRLVGNAEMEGGGLGVATGLAGGAGIAYALGATGLAVAMWPLVGALVGKIALANIAKKIASANSLPEMEKQVREAVAMFKEEVSQIKSEMTLRILDTVDRMFRQEIESADKAFAEFRISVNIDGRNVPLLEEKMRLIQGYIAQLEERMKNE